MTTLISSHTPPSLLMSCEIPSSSIRFAFLKAGLRVTADPYLSQVIYPYSRRQEIIALLEEHITENLVKIGNEYYRQVIGIPQGSVLSAILCSFFYGDLERKKFKFTNDPECVRHNVLRARR